MHLRQSIFLLLIAGTGFAQNSQIPNSLSRVPGAVLDTPDTELEAAQKANPDDLRVAWKLLQYLGREHRDPNWSARFPLVTWYVEHHPDASFFSSPDAYADLPDTLRTQLKQTWITQVHQHADNPVVLRNAATAMSAHPPFPSSIRVSGNVQAATLIGKVDPVYPPLAKQAGIQGVVKFNVTVGKEGGVENVQLVSGHPLLVAAAVVAVQQYRYKPTLLNGQPVDVITSVDVPFTLGQ